MKERLHYYQIELQSNMAYVDFDLVPFACSIYATTLVLHGNNDKMVPLEWAQSLADRVSHAQFHIVDSGPHGMIFHMASVGDMVIDFIKDQR